MANPNQEARDGHGRYIRTPEGAAQDARAAELRAEGWKLPEIAEELGFASKTSAGDAIRRALREIVKGPAEKLLALHVERLETLYEAALEVLEAEHVVVSHGKVVTMLDPDTGEEKTLKDNGPKLAAIREARTTLESFRKLMGLDQPTQVAVSGSVKYEVIGVSSEDLA
jgi:hypothetical protein